jgi:tricorn protease-like protein
MDRDLMDYIRSVSSRPFKWGEHDCLSFANECVRIQRGQGFVDEWMGGYSTPLGALAKYRREQKRRKDYRSIVDVADDRLEPVDTLHPRTGMIVARPTKQIGLGYAFGVVVSIHSVFVGEGGLEVLPQELGDLYWSV